MAALSIAKIKATPTIRQQQPVGNGAMPTPQWVDCVAVSAVAVNYTVPANIAVIRLTPTTAAVPAYGCVTGVAAVPAAHTDGSASFPIPAGVMFNIPPATTLSLVGAAAGFITLEGWT